jgi:sulfate adenylyltransferase subunit 1
MNYMKINGDNKFKSLLRFTTAGSVDDGKSTLIGRLLYDSKSIFEDQMEHIINSSKRLGKEETDLSLLTDGLRAEREQGITIDVAYRYFSTPARKFIIADTPGHIQYTRNMVTGASTADLAVILIDARKGVLEQTMRHTYIATLLDIRHIVFCINKMDLVAYAESVFLRLRNDLEILCKKLNTGHAYFIPISAKLGDNVVDASENMKWYSGKTFLNLIETVEIEKDKSSFQSRFPVQTVIRPISQEFHDFRGFAGRVAGGAFRKGDDVVLLPGEQHSAISDIFFSEKSKPEALTGDSVVLTLEDQIDITRGCLIVKNNELPHIGQELNLMICWFNEKPFKPGTKYLVRNYSNEVICILKNINYKVNINTLEQDFNDLTIRMNDIANVSIKTAKALFYDPYRQNSITGSLVFIDPGTNETVAAGMIEENV